MMRNSSLSFVVLEFLLKENVERFQTEQEPVHFRFLIVACRGKSPFLAYLPCDSVTILIFYGLCYFASI